MSSSDDLVFNDTRFDVIDRNGQPWIKASQLAEALGYAREDKISRLYQRSADEFTESMTQVIEISEDPRFGATGRFRIFSLRGCHLLAMFARTPVAKAFRVWVLDVLEALNKAEVRELPQYGTTLQQVITKMNASGRPVYATGRNSLYARRHELPAPFSTMSKRQLYALAQSLDPIPYEPITPQPKALPLAPQYFEEDELELHWNAIRAHVRGIREHEQAVFAIVKNGIRPALRDINTPRRSLAVQAHTAMERLFYSLDYGLEAAEATVRTALIASRI